MLRPDGSAENCQTREPRGRQQCANGPGHGPYWYRYRWYDGKMHKRYVGKRLPQQDYGPSPNTATIVGVSAQLAN
jgi:hypothetical protein